jgi:hypothetical protein
MFGIEEFVRPRDPFGSPVPEDDLFAGVRAHEQPLRTPNTTR